jgi:Ran GTPase-activating protein (RanGAP) involved in mRNA processing and transport
MPQFTNINLKLIRFDLKLNIQDNGRTGYQPTWIPSKQYLSIEGLEIKQSTIGTTAILHHSISATTGSIAMSKFSSWNNLRTLNLGDNKIGDQGARALSKNSSWSNLTTLNLNSNQIGVEGATALSKNSSFSNLTTLNLGNNKIGVENLHWNLLMIAATIILKLVNF